MLADYHLERYKANLPKYRVYSFGQSNCI